MNIEIQKTVVEKTFPQCITVLITGMPKSGKTTNSLGWNNGNMLSLDCEYGTRFYPGANSIQVRSLFPPKRPKLIDGKHVLTADSKKVMETIPPEERGFFYLSGENQGNPMPVYSLYEVFLFLQKEIDNLPFDGYILDTLDDVNTWIEAAVCEELGISAIGEGSYGADWGKAKTKMQKVILPLKNLFESRGKTFIMIAHSKPTTETDGTKQQSTVLPSGMASAIAAKAELIGFASVNKKGEFTIKFQSYQEKQFGSRIKALAQKELPFDYKKIVEEYERYMVEEENNGTSKTTKG